MVIEIVYSVAFQPFRSDVLLPILLNLSPQQMSAIISTKYEIKYFILWHIKACNELQIIFYTFLFHLRFVLLEIFFKLNSKFLFNNKRKERRAKEAKDKYF